VAMQTRHHARGLVVDLLCQLQAEGSWTTAKLLLDVYGHFLPSEYRAMRTRFRGRPTHPMRTLSPVFRLTAGATVPQVAPVARVSGYPSSRTGPRSPIMHLDSDPEESGS
jgi:hypothetical protein